MQRANNTPQTSVYPRLIESHVFRCGFTSPKSYGAMSYFIQHPSGNWLVDSPRFEPYLVEQFRQRGGLSKIFLTHQDDVADAHLYAETFKAERLIHEADRRAQPNAEFIIKGIEPVEIVPGFTIIPVPGHTRGHCVLLHENFLFTGDHLEWDPEIGGLNAFRDFCWYDWTEQTRSMERLANFSFEWILPGHGRAQKLPTEEMNMALKNLIERMRK